MISGPSCPSCHSRDLVEVTLRPEGEPVVFAHCRACEHRWWRAAGAQNDLRLTDVLDRVK